MEAKATVRQIYALAAALCERAGEEFPETREAASELIERLRIENRHPAPRLGAGPGWAPRGGGAGGERAAPNRNQPSGAAARGLAVSAALEAPRDGQGEGERGRGRART